MVMMTTMTMMMMAEVEEGEEEEEDKIIIMVMVMVMIIVLIIIKTAANNGLDLIVLCILKMSLCKRQYTFVRHTLSFV